MHPDRVAAHCLLRSCARRLFDHRRIRVPWHGLTRADGAVSLWGLLHRAALDVREGSPNTWQMTLLATTGLAISSFGQDQGGELYVVNHNGAVYRVTAHEPIALRPTRHRSQ